MGKLLTTFHRDNRHTPGQSHRLKPVSNKSTLGHTRMYVLLSNF